MAVKEDKLWEQLIREVQKVAKGGTVEIIDTDFLRHQAERSRDRLRKTPGRLVKWPVSKPRTNW